ncbi:MAG TPA: PAC2 family protein [Planctomycetota bacterium]|nr:PAC2 family protein [Planctomycetota bacterium]
MASNLRRPWLVAVWPGMGGVAQIAGNYLARQLDAQPIAELDATPYFEPQSITVKKGLVSLEPLPRSVFYAWRNPRGERDLLVLAGDRQPNAAAYRYAEALMEIAAAHHVERVVTFAAMATPLHPSAAPRVFGVATREDLLPELRMEKTTLLEEGEISGLNGVFLAAATARKVPGLCLMGEIPFFAAPLPNPKASAAVLDVFGRLFGVQVDLAPMRAEAEKIERSLVEHLENLQRAAREAAGKSPDDEEEGEEESEMSAEAASDAGADANEPPPAPAEPKRKPPPPEVMDRIEKLFAAARQDRNKALELKTELDRYGLFKEFEDRFLDLFKRAG